MFFGFVWFFFCSCLLRASRSGKIKVVARTDDFSAGAGLTRRKYLALKKFSFTDPRVLLVWFFFRCLNVRVLSLPTLRSDAATGQGATELSRLVVRRCLSMSRSCCTVQNLQRGGFPLNSSANKSDFERRAVGNRLTFLKNCASFFFLPIFAEC